METTGVSATSGSSARELFGRSREEKKATREKARTERNKPKPRPPSATRSIEPGVFHYRIAEGALRLLQAQAAARGVPLDVGEFPDPDDNAELDQDPQRLVGLTAHAVARLADRFSLTRRFSRHMEGKERRAGILSDVGAALVCLYKRNPGAMESLARNFTQEVQAAHTRRTTSQQGPTVSNGAGNPDHITPQEGIVNA